MSDKELKLMSERIAARAIEEITAVIKRNPNHPQVDAMKAVVNGLHEFDGVDATRMPNREEILGLVAFAKLGGNGIKL